MNQEEIEAIKKEKKIEVVTNGGNFFATVLNLEGINVVSVSLCGPSEEWVVTKVSEFLEKVGIEDGVVKISTTSRDLGDS